MRAIQNHKYFIKDYNRKVQEVMQNMQGVMQKDAETTNAHGRVDYNGILLQKLIAITKSTRGGSTSTAAKKDHKLQRYFSP